MAISNAPHCWWGPEFCSYFSHWPLERLKPKREVMACWPPPGYPTYRKSTLGFANTLALIRKSRSKSIGCKLILQSTRPEPNQADKRADLKGNCSPSQHVILSEITVFLTEKNATTSRSMCAHRNSSNLLESWCFGIVVMTGGYWLQIIFCQYLFIKRRHTLGIV